MRNFLRLLFHFRQLWRYYALIGGVTVIIALLNQATPFLTKAIVDRLVGAIGSGSVPTQAILIIVGLIIVVEITVTLLSNYSGYHGDLLVVRLYRLVGERYYQHLLHLPQSYFDSELSGRVVNRLNRGIVDIVNFTKQLTNNFIPFILTALVTLIVIAFYSWPIALLLTLMFPFYFWLTKRSSRVWKQYEEQIVKDEDYAKARLQETITQMRAVKSYGAQNQELDFYLNRFGNVYDTTQEQSRHWHKYDIYRRVSMNLIIAVSIGYIGWLAFREVLTIGEFTLLLQLIIQVRMPLFASSMIVDGLQRVEVNSRDYFRVLAEPTEVREDGRQLEVVDGEVEFQSVDFSYDSEPVLRDVSFRIEPHQKAALIGQSGEGKTTIAHLMLGLYKPSDGKILIDGQPLSEVTAESLRTNTSVVFQEPALFSGTVRENIAYGHEEMEVSKIKQAAEPPNASGFIEKLPKKYQTQIGERGVKLSGGQKQRIAIARAILKDAPILILDEATSSLDSIAEAKVQKGLNNLMEGRTTLIIAHRLSTIQHVDKIISLQNGTVAEVGAPEELAENGGIYSMLLQLQQSGQDKEAILEEYDMIAE